MQAQRLLSPEEIVETWISSSGRGLYLHLGVEKNHLKRKQTIKYFIQFWLSFFLPLCLPPSFTPLFLFSLSLPVFQIFYLCFPPVSFSPSLSFCIKLIVQAVLKLTVNHRVSQNPPFSCLSLSRVVLYQHVTPYVTQLFDLHEQFYEAYGEAQFDR